ncbi:MAG: hypothetical protein JXR10_05255 [Cyclobacteriaceae bacterium]
MPILKITSIVCEIPEEDDQDEIYLVYRDKKIWPKDQKFLKIDYDERLPVGIQVKLNKPGRMKLELMEYDLASANDHLGTFQLDIVSLKPAAYTELLLRDEKGAKRASYYLNWEIIE